MPRTDGRSWLIAVALLCACGEDAGRERHQAPSEGVLPSGGKAGGGEDAPDPEPVPGTSDGGSAGDNAGEGGAADAGRTGDVPDLTVGTELSLRVEGDAPTYVTLASAAVVEVAAGEGATSTAWDLVFEGWEIFTNGGASGSGKGAAFGPLPFTYFLAAEEPADVPFLIEDKAAGALRDWYFYDGQWHALYSRFHVYGVKSGQRLFKLQLLGYYGDVQGAPISALYHLRYAEVTPDSNGETIDIQKLDATAGGLGGDDQAASGCLTLATGEQRQLTPTQAAASSFWDLRFRRDSISVNGGLGGPGSVTAVDLDASATEGETLDSIKGLTAENQASRFAAVDYAALTASELDYRGDRIVSAFTDAWFDPSVQPHRLAEDDTWLVVGADGDSRYLIGFTGVEDASTEAAGTVVLRILRVR